MECLALSQVTSFHSRTFNIVEKRFHSFFFNWEFADRECPELPQPEVGSVNMTGREFGGKAIYTCPIGQNVIGVIWKMKILAKSKLQFYVFSYCSFPRDYVEMVNGLELNRFVRRTVKHPFSLIYPLKFCIQFSNEIFSFPLTFSNSILFDTTSH